MAAPTLKPVMPYDPELDRAVASAAKARASGVTSTMTTKKTVKGPSVDRVKPVQLRPGVTLWDLVSDPKTGGVPIQGEDGAVSHYPKASFRRSARAYLDQPIPQGVTEGWLQDAADKLSGWVPTATIQAKTAAHEQARQSAEFDRAFPGMVRARNEEAAQIEGVKRFRAAPAPVRFAGQFASAAMQTERGLGIPVPGAPPPKGFAEEAGSMAGSMAGFVGHILPLTALAGPAGTAAGIGPVTTALIAEPLAAGAVAASGQEGNWRARLAAGGSTALTAGLAYGGMGVAARSISRAAVGEATGALMGSTPAQTYFRESMELAQKAGLSGEDAVAWAQKISAQKVKDLLTPVAARAGARQAAAGALGPAVAWGGINPYLNYALSNALGEPTEAPKLRDVARNIAMFGALNVAMKPPGGTRPIDTGGSGGGGGFTSTGPDIPGRALPPGMGPETPVPPYREPPARPLNLDPRTLELARRIVNGGKPPDVNVNPYDGGRTREAAGVDRVARELAGVENPTDEQVRAAAAKARAIGNGMEVLRATMIDPPSTPAEIAAATPQVRAFAQQTSRDLTGTLAGKDLDLEVGLPGPLRAKVMQVAFFPWSPQQVRVLVSDAEGTVAAFRFASLEDFRSKMSVAAPPAQKPAGEAVAQPPKALPGVTDQWRGERPVPPVATHPGETNPDVVALRNRTKTAAMRLTDPGIVEAIYAYHTKGTPLPGPVADAYERSLSELSGTLTRKDVSRIARNPETLNVERFARALRNKVAARVKGPLKELGRGPVAVPPASTGGPPSVVEPPATPPVSKRVEGAVSREETKPKAAAPAPAVATPAPTAPASAKASGIKAPSLGGGQLPADGGRTPPEVAPEGGSRPPTPKPPAVSTPTRGRTLYPGQVFSREADAQGFADRLNLRNPEREAKVLRIKEGFAVELIPIPGKPLPKEVDREEVQAKAAAAKRAAKGLPPLEAKPGAGRELTPPKKPESAMSDAPPPPVPPKEAPAPVAAAPETPAKRAAAPASAPLARGDRVMGPNMQTGFVTGVLKNGNVSVVWDEGRKANVTPKNLKKLPGAAPATEAELAEREGKKPVTPQVAPLKGMTPLGVAPAKPLPQLEAPGLEVPLALTNQPGAAAPSGLSFDAAFDKAWRAGESAEDALATAEKESGQKAPAEFNAEIEWRRRKRKALDDAGQIDMFGNKPMLGEAGKVGVGEAREDIARQEAKPGEAVEKVAAVEGKISDASLPVAEIRTDRRFQMRNAMVREENIRTLLEKRGGVSLDEIRANPPIVWHDVHNQLEGGKGLYYVLDGHHRLELAKYDWGTDPYGAWVRTGVSAREIPVKVYSGTLAEAEQYAKTVNQKGVGNTHSELARIAYDLAAQGKTPEEIQASLSLKSAGAAQALVDFFHVDPSVRDQYAPDGNEAGFLPLAITSTLGKFVRLNPEIFTVAVQRARLKKAQDRNQTAGVFLDETAQVRDRIKAADQEVIDGLPPEQAAAGGERVQDVLTRIIEASRAVETATKVQIKFIKDLTPRLSAELGVTSEKALATLERMEKDRTLLKAVMAYAKKSAMAIYNRWVGGGKDMGPALRALEEEIRAKLAAINPDDYGGGMSAFGVGELGRSTARFVRDQARRMSGVRDSMNRLRRRAPAVLSEMLDRGTEGIPAALEEAKLINNAYVSAGESVFRQMGTAGNELADLLVVVRKNTLRRIGRETREVELMSHKFKKSEAERILNIMEGAPTNDSRLQEAADRLSEIMAEYDLEALNLGLPQMNSATGTINPYQGRENYAPHIFTAESIRRIKSPAIRSAMLKRYRKLPPDVRSGNLQFHREDNMPGYEKNAFIAVIHYIERSSARVEQAKLLGVHEKGGVADELMKTIGRERGFETERQVREIYEAIIQPGKVGYSPIGSALRNLSAPLFLTYSGFLQPAQVMTNTVAREGVINTVKGVAKWASNPADRERCVRTGAALHSALDEMLGARSLSAMWARIIGLSTADRHARIISGLAAEERARQVSRGLARGKFTPGNLIDAKRLGIDIKAIIRQGGDLTPDQAADAMLLGAINTQFLGDALSMPLKSRSGWGRVLYIYKTFTINHGRFVKDLVKDAKAGYHAPLLRFIVSMGTGGVIYGELMRLLRGKPAPDSMAWRIIEDVLAVAGAGVFADLLMATGRSAESVYSFFSGAIFGETIGTTVDVGAAIQGNPRPIQRRILRRTVSRVPIIGPKLYDRMNPKPPKKASTSTAPSPFAPSIGGSW